MLATAAVLHEPGGVPMLEEVELDAPRDGEVLVELRATGVCHTDLGAIDGQVDMPYPVVLGHEGAGVVLESRAEGLAEGDSVVLTFDSCGACATCRSGRPAYCADFHARNHSGRRPDGSTTMGAVHGSFLGQSSFATHAIATQRNAVAVPAGDLAPLAALGCSVQTGAGAVLNVLRPPAGARLAVFGCGAVGLSAVMAAASAGCAAIVAVDPREDRRALALALGATDALPPGERIRGIDFSVEAVGTQDALDAALRCLTSPGACATLGFRGPHNPLMIDQGRLLFGRSLHGVIEGDADPQRFIPRLLGLGLPLERLVTRYPFAAVGEALAAARSGAAVKPVLIF
jgi:aryl-alcohol dehydrogenase